METHLTVSGAGAPFLHKTYVRFTEGRLAVLSETSILEFKDFVRK